MICEKRTVGERGFFLTYPFFTVEAGESGADERNAFYEALASAAREAAASLSPGRTYAAEYALRDADTVEYTVRVRKGGRTVWKRTFSHTWKNGGIVRFAAAMPDTAG